MHRLYKLLFALFFLPNLVVAQNLVPNPSFEDTTGCPHWLGHFYALSWNSPSYGSPDLFHTCSTGQLGVPQNVLGWQQPRTGLAYAGGHASDFSGNNSREYMQCQLTQPLEAGEKYEVSFWVSRADSATKACDNLGAYFSAMPVSALNAYNLPYSPQIVSQPNSPLTDALNWTQVIDTFTAVGAEEYLTIGIFTDDANTNWIPTPGGIFHEPYYYIDDVSVRKAVVSSVEENSGKQISISPNPAHDLITLSIPALTGTYDLTILDVQGREVFSQQNIPAERTTHMVSQLPLGLFFIKVSHNNQVYFSKLLKQ